MWGGGSGGRNKDERERRQRENCEFHNYLKLSSLSPSSLPDTWVRISESNQKTLSSPEVLLSLSVSILYSKNVNLKAWIKNTTNVQVVQLCLCTLRCVADTQWYVIMPGHSLLRARLITVGVKTGNHIEHTPRLWVLHLWHQSPSHCLRLCDLHNQTQYPNEGGFSLIYLVFSKLPVNKLKIDIFKVQDALILRFQT